MGLRLKVRADCHYTLLSLRLGLLLEAGEAVKIQHPKESLAQYLVFFGRQEKSPTVMTVRRKECKRLLDTSAAVAHPKCLAPSALLPLRLMLWAVMGGKRDIVCALRPCLQASIRLCMHVLPTLHASVQGECSWRWTQYVLVIALPN